MDDVLLFKTCNCAMSSIVECDLNVLALYKNSILNMATFFFSLLGIPY